MSDDRDSYPFIQGGRVDPGDAFLLDGEAWFVCAAGDLAILANNGEGKMRSFTPEALKEARRIGPRWLALMQGVAAMKGSIIGYKFAPKGLPAPIRDWLLEEMRVLSALVDGTVDELEEQEAEAENG